MKEVDISYMYNQCLSYALKRVGIDSLENCTKINWNEPLLPSDILAWKQDKSQYITQPIKITEDGKIISIAILENIHYGVYEGNGLVSDLSYQDSYPIIRVRELDKLTSPDFIHRVIKKEN